MERYEVLKIDGDFENTSLILLNRIDPEYKADTLDEAKKLISNDGNKNIQYLIIKFDNNYPSGRIAEIVNL